MAKDYGRKRSTHRGGSASRPLLLILVGFLAGYLSASFFDFAQLMSFINTQFIAKTELQTPAKPIAQQAQLPKPKFEFYTLLANDHADTTQHAPPAAAAPEL